jgi:multidrug efflux pump subunit AcrA (membrane-fusion protein)
VLTSIVSSDGIYADFEVDEQTFKKSIRADADTADKEHKIPVELTVQGDASHVYKGTIYSFDNRINTASARSRPARFDNKDSSLVPGMFVSVKLGNSPKSQVLLILNAQSATTRTRNSSMWSAPTTRLPIAKSISASRWAGGASFFRPSCRRTCRRRRLQHIAPT